MPTLALHAAAALARALPVLAGVSVALSAQQPARPLSQPPTPRIVRPQELPGPTPSDPTNTTRGLRDRAELEAFLDGVMAANLADKHVNGATVAVVKDGALFFAKGYGFADAKQRNPVSGERSLFRIGSISKLFTWTAVMQLVEQGKLDLDTDVNKYLDFKIPDTYPQPITLRHVMTHTPGFEEDGRDLITSDTTRMLTLGKWLATVVASAGFCPDAISTVKGSPALYAPTPTRDSRRPASSSISRSSASLKPSRRSPSLVRTQVS